MSEQEKKSGGSTAGGSSVVMMEQSAASRHKQPYRPTDLQEDAPELHHKRSKAPAVPSVTEEMRDSVENLEIKERKEYDGAMPSEKHKHNAAKKLSPSSKRRDSSPETIAMAPIEVDTKKSTVSPQPIPARMGPASSTAIKVAKREKEAKKKEGDDDSITEEIAEMRTPEMSKKESEWDGENMYKDDTNSQDTVSDKEHITATTSHVAIQSKSTNENLKDNITDSNIFKKKEITWYDGSYLPKEHNMQDLDSRSKAWMLERKVSVGPCFGTGTPIGEPNGITICVPKKSVRSMNDDKPSQSGICIKISRKCLDKPTKSGIDFVRKSCGDRVTVPSKANTREIKIEEESIKFLDNIKGKLDNMYGKIKNALRI